MCAKPLVLSRELGVSQGQDLYVVRVGLVGLFQVADRLGLPAAGFGVLALELREFAAQSDDLGLVVGVVLAGGLEAVLELRRGAIERVAADAGLETPRAGSSRAAMAPCSPTGCGASSLSLTENFSHGWHYMWTLTCSNDDFRQG